MVGLTDRLWPAGIAACVLHSLIIATLAFGLTMSQGVQQNTLNPNFLVEVAWAAETKPETVVAPEQDAQALESDPVQQTDQGLEKPCKLISALSKKPYQKSMVLSVNGQKKPQHGLTEGDPTPVHNPAPIYPREARRKKIEGVVLARLSLTASGAVEKVAILPPHTDLVLEEAALRVLLQWRFAPGARIVDVPIEFRLKE